MKPTVYHNVHKKTIRDMCFSPTERGNLLSVSLDKTAKLFDLQSNTVVQTFEGKFTQLWSNYAGGLLIILFLQLLFLYGHVRGVLLTITSSIVAVRTVRGLLLIKGNQDPSQNKSSNPSILMIKAVSYRSAIYLPDPEDLCQVAVSLLAGKSYVRLNS